MISIHFNRQTNTARRATSDGWDYFATGTDPYFDVARAMTDLGEPDGPAVFVDERGVACMTVRSVHACAGRHRPNAGDLAAKRARKLADVEAA